MCQPIDRDDQQIKNVKRLLEQEVPTNFIAKNWLRIHRSMPTICFPATKLDISFFLFGVVFLTAVRYSLQAIMINVVGWQPEDSPGLDFYEAIGSMTAMVHSLILVPALFVALTTQPYRITEHMSTAPEWWQNFVHAILQFCTGYMVYDSLTSFILLKGVGNLDGADFLFLGHHIATAVYMTQCRVLEAGHTSAMICMFLGELTNPFQNGTTAVGHAIKVVCCNGPLMHQIHQVLETCFAFSYFGIRAIIAPVFFAHATFGLLLESTRKNIPLLVRILWIAAIWGVEIGSYAWIVDCWHMVEARLGIAETSGEALAGEL